jgi:DNA-binding transcriptional LysR family regulator
MIRNLRTFLVAAETASFSAAGARLGLTQSAVSTQIRRLEEEFDCLLFDRTGKSVSLSDEGRKLLPDARRIVELYQGMKQQGKGSGSAAPIDLGAITTVQSMLLPRVLHAFRKTFPAIHVNIIPGTSIQLLAQVDSRELDIAVIIKPRLGIPADLRWITLMRERYVGIAPTGAPADLQELLSALPFIRYSRGSHGGQLVDRFLKQHGLWVRDGMELDEPGVILNMVSEGLGCAIIPGQLVPLETTPGVQVFELPGKPLFREIGVLVRQSALKAAGVVGLVESFGAEAGARHPE